MDTKIYENQISNLNGAVISQFESITINNCIFNNNKALQYGGSIFISTNSQLNTNINNSIFLKNFDLNGGCIYIHSINSNIYINNTLFNLSNAN